MQCEKCGAKVFANEVCSCGQKAPKKNNGGVLANTVVCFILLWLTVFSLILTLSLRTAVNKNMFVESIQKADLADIMIDDKKLDQYIYDEYVDDPRITVENVDNLLQEDFIKDFIIEKVEAYQDYCLDKGDMPYITSDDIVELIDDNSELLFEEAGLRFLEPDKQELRQQLAKLDSFQVDSKDFFNSKFGSAMSQTYFSYANAVFLIILMAVIFIQWLVVYKANARRASKMLIKYGIAVIIPSFIILAASTAGKIINEFDFADKLAGSAVIPFMVYSAVFLILGIIITVMGSIANKNYKTAGTAPENIDKSGVVPEYSAAPASVDSPRTNICPNCSFANKDKASFCAKCGTNLKETAND